MHLRVDLGRQCLELFGADGACIRRYRVSTARNGAGEARGSRFTFEVVLPLAEEPGARA